MYINVHFLLTYICNKHILTKYLTISTHIIFSGWFQTFPRVSLLRIMEFQNVLQNSRNI